jgi:putative nucleotidyltransferase-like protein
MACREWACWNAGLRGTTLAGSAISLMPDASFGLFADQIPNLLGLLSTDGNPDWFTCDKQWRSFVQACDYHQVVTQVRCRLKGLENKLPPEFLHVLTKRCYEIAANNYHLAREVVNITSQLQEHGISTLTYKGPAVAMSIYGDIAFRQYNDLDVVVRSADLLEAASVLTRNGFMLAPDSSQPRNLQNASGYDVVTLAAPARSYFVDLHWHFSPEYARAFCPSEEEIWGNSEKIQLPCGRVLTLSPEDSFVVLCFHGAKHRWCRLKWLCDVAEMLRNADRMDWERIEKIMLERPLAKAAVALGVSLVKDLLHVTVPERIADLFPDTARVRAVGSKIRQEIFARGFSREGDHKDLLRLEGSIRAWLNYLCVRYPKWFFRSSVMHIYPQDRAVLRLPERLGFLYHFVRPIRLLVKHSSRLVRTVLHARESD